MGFWIAFAVMTGVAVFAVLWPLSRPRARRADHDIAVYRSQLTEIDEDLARGVIEAADAEAARLEVKRRLLAAADGRVSTGATKGAARRKVIAGLALVALPLFAILSYLALGAPGYDDQPHAAREQTPPGHQDMAALVARVEARLAQNPEDGRGWEILGPVYMRSGRYADAVRARSNALRLLGATADREADLGEAIYASQSGVVAADARRAFERALALDDKHPKARFFLGVAEQQDGRKEQAVARWRALLADSPADAPWRGVVENAIARLQGSEATPPIAPRGPTADDVANANKLSPEERDGQIRAMVERLADRLKTDGGDVDSWERLLRAYAVLGDVDKGRSALATARTALAADPDKLKRIEALAKGLGFGG